MVALIAVLMTLAVVPAEAKGWRTSRRRTVVRVVKRPDPPFVCLYVGQSYYTQQHGWKNCTQRSP